MKCVRMVGQGVPVRMPDDEAHQIVVHEGDGEYCSKSFWKGWHRMCGTEDRAYAKGTGLQLSKAST